MTDAPMTGPDPVSPFPAALDRIAATIDPARVFLQGGERALSYGALFDRVRRLAAFFHSRGLGPGSRVVIASRDDAHVATLLVAMIRCGVTAVIADPAAPADELCRLVRAADAHGVMIDDALPAGAQARSCLRETCRHGGGTFVTLHGEGERTGGVLGRLLRRAVANDAVERYPALLADHAPGRLPDGLPADTRAYILFTSGTTSDPKGVEITHANLFAHVATLNRVYGYNARTRILNQLPFHHTDGIVEGPMCALLAGAAVHRPGPFAVPRVAQLAGWIARHRITHLVTVPTVLALIDRLAGADPAMFRTPDFRFVVSLAGALDAGLWQRFEERFGVRVVNVYGLTETVSGSLYAGPDEASHRIGTVGKPVDCACRIVDADGRDVPPGAVGELAVGELLLRGDHVMPGYFRNPQATAAAIRDGWLCTGDLATVDADGFYSIVGRKKNVVIRGGINVYPEKVNAALKTHPEVVDAATFGMPDPVWGETVVACVSLRAPVPPERLIAHCRTLIAPESIPAEIHVLEDFPRGPAGKPVLNALKEIVAARRAAAPEKPPKKPPAAPDLTAELYAIAARCFKTVPSALSPDSTPDNTAGWDSYAHMELTVALETGLGIRLAPRDIMNMVSLDAVERIVRGKLAA